ncbi:MAG: hypothetical protein MUC84_06290 [Solirubrobacteraceae bacterium]|nr:hypothetical protein [Solirubrobacteraceae bacterium]
MTPGVFGSSRPVMRPRTAERLRLLRRTLAASAALFAALLVLLAAQLALGRDPAVRDGAARGAGEPTQTAAVPEAEASIGDVVVSTVLSALAGDEDDEESGQESAPALRSGTS